MQRGGKQGRWGMREKILEMVRFKILPHEFPKFVLNTTPEEFATYLETSLLKDFDIFPKGQGIALKELRGYIEIIQGEVNKDLEISIKESVIEVNYCGLKPTALTCKPA